METEQSTKGIRTSGTHVSFWTESVESIRFQPLKQNIKTEVVIVGGGLAGISVAYCLCKAGKKVVLVEDGFIGSGETGRTTAHLSNALDDRYYELERVFGEEGARLAAESHRAAIDFIGHVAFEEKIECRYKRVDGYLFLHPSDDPSSLEDEFKAAIKAGVQVEKVDTMPGILVKKPALKFPNQAQFHPLLYLKGLADAIIRMGGQIFTETHADKINKTGIVTSAGFTVEAEHVVVATNSPVKVAYTVPLKEFPYRTYVIGALIKKSELPEALWWDSGDYEANPEMPPYHYVRTEYYNDEYDLLISGGEDHGTGLAEADGVSEEERYALLEKWTREHFPIDEIVYRWSGQVLEPMDSLAYIGHSPGDAKNIYIVSGDSGHGMTHCTIAGMLITDLILGKENKWQKLYDPSRIKIFKSGSTLLKELASTFTGYVKTHPANTDAQQITELKKGEGVIVKLEGKKYGVFRDENNQLHWVSTICPHMKCTVRWNNDERTWDCPCHGSRFNHEGKVLNGPANSDLEYHKDLYPGN